MGNLSGKKGKTAFEVETMIGIIGSFCDNRDSASGQAVRTTMLYKILCDKYGKNNIYRVNTHGFRSNPIRVVFKTIGCIYKCKNIIVMVHENGRKVFFPILAFSAKLFKRNVYHNVIGGSFAEYLEENPRLIKSVKRFKINWVQMQSQIEKLKQIGINNTELLPNTKTIKVLSEDCIEEYNDKIFRFCMCSRISIAKGTEAAIDAIEEINRRYGRIIATLDIYGKPDEDYEERFRKRLKACSSAIKYCGFIPNEETVQRLSGYYMLLFPSTYEGEGFPGTVWDAFAAGVPIIATNWHYNSEIITDGVTGYIFDYRNMAELVNRIEFAIHHRSEVNTMRFECLIDIQKYTPQRVLPIIFKYFD